MYIEAVLVSYKHNGRKKTVIKYCNEPFVNSGNQEEAIEEILSNLPPMNGMVVTIEAKVINVHPINKTTVVQIFQNPKAFVKSATTAFVSEYVCHEFAKGKLEWFQKIQIPRQI